MSDLKFRYVYSNGKEIKSFVYNIEEIEQGLQNDDECVLGIKGFKLISRDRFTGLKDKNGAEIFKNDIIKLHIFCLELGENLGVIEGESETTEIVKFNEMGVCFQDEPLFAYSGVHEESFEIISNTHIEELKKDEVEK